jgi:hypothetical protein
MTNYALTATHTSSYNLIQTANRLFREDAPKKSQAPSVAEGPAVRLSP